ncbi:MAG: hypothetical protein HOI95_06840 [Chromatiales bacterium]|jgi:hypothetical protein|nr:hypothetical protein [Chromatiales bacterium]
MKSRPNGRLQTGKRIPRTASQLLLAAVLAFSGQAVLAQLTSSKSLNDLNVTKGTYGEILYWKEASVTLPKFPAKDNLTPITLNLAGISNQYYIDEKSLSFGDDLILRYTVVIRSKADAVNVLYEGLSCRTREFKSYAYGTGNSEFHTYPKARWKPITRHGVMGFREVLFSKYACAASSAALPVSEVLVRLRKGGQVMHSSWSDDRPDS